MYIAINKAGQSAKVNIEPIFNYCQTKLDVRWICHNDEIFSMDVIPTDFQGLSGTGTVNLTLLEDYKTLAGAHELFVMWLETHDFDAEIID